MMHIIEITDEIHAMPETTIDDLPLPGDDEDSVMANALRRAIAHRRARERGESGDVIAAFQNYA